VVRRYAADPRYRGAVDRELARQLEESPRNAMAHNFRANLALFQFRTDEARSELEAALAVDPELPNAWERLGLIALRDGRPRDALAAFERQRSQDAAVRGLELRIGQAWQRLGDPARARVHYRRELARFPDDAEARDSLAALGGP